MKHYKLTQEDLEDFAKKVYEEACYGYLDLKDSVCVGLVSIFLEGKTIFDTNLNGSSYLGIPPLNSGNNTVSFQPGITINRSGISLGDPHPVPSLPPLVLPSIIQDGMQEISNGMQEILNGSSILNRSSNLSVNSIVGSTVWLNSNSNVVLIADTQQQQEQQEQQERHRRQQTNNSNFESERFIYG